ncbi:MAG: protein-disulfide reductase DsbD domain-containing protein [Pseudomonadota bacterium]
MVHGLNQPELFRRHMMLLRFLLIALIALPSLVSGPAVAGSSLSYQSERITARLITAENGLAPDTRVISAALEITLADGWKTYWRAPGIVGYPVEIDWTRSANLATSELQWPAPKRFEAFEIENYGYESAVTFPIRLSAETPGETMVLNADINLLVCADLCVPEIFSLSMVLPTGATIDRNAGALIADAAARLPIDAAVSDIEITAAGLDTDANRLELSFKSDAAFQDLSVIPDMGLDAAFGPPDIALGPDSKTASAAFDILSLPAELPPLRIVATDDTRAVEFAPTLSDALPMTGAQISLAWVFLAALMGGLILNVMPCVLPVLTIKFASVLKAGGQSRSRIRAGFLATTLGVLSFMWLLAAILLAIRAGGGAVGWGIQFQSPHFLAALVGLILLFAANLFGLFEFALPQSWNTKLSNTRSEGLVGDFATGALAAVLATPCSAPFLGTAVAVALAGSAPETLAIFTALGLGLALPYLLVALWPGLLRGLPKPGPWMIWVKYAMGLLLLASAAWLIWVLSALVGTLAALLGLACFGLAALVMSGWKHGPRWAGVAVLALGGVMLPALIAQPVEATAKADDPIGWTDFAPSEIAALIDDGQVVFVDVTADWCLSCKANKRLVLDRDPVLDALSDDDVTPMLADWTKPDAAILDYLQMNGRYGIPFNIVYGPDAPRGIALPEILTPGLVIDAIEEAGG